MPEPAELLSELLERCRQRDRQAATRLVQRFHGYALALARALVDDRHTADDVVQEAMLTMLARLDDLRDPNAFAGWLRQIVRSHANRLRRRAQLKPPGQTAAAPASPLDDAQLDELRRHVRSAVASLPPASQQAAELYYLSELDQSQVADRLEVPLGTVKRRLHDARVKLREMLDLPL